MFLNFKLRIKKISYFKSNFQIQEFYLNSDKNSEFLPMITLKNQIIIYVNKNRVQHWFWINIGKTNKKIKPNPKSITNRGSGDRDEQSFKFMNPKNEAKIYV